MSLLVTGLTSTGAHAQASASDDDAGVPELARRPEPEPATPALEANSHAEVIEVVAQRASEATRKRESSEAVKVIETASAQAHTADIGTLLARTEGVSIQRSGGVGSSTRVSLHGLTDDQIRMFMDGVPLALSGFGLGIATVPISWVERIDVFRGVVPIAYATDALGGVIDLISSENLKRTGFHASFSTGSFDTHGMSLNGRYYDPRSHIYARAGAFLDVSDNDYVVTAEVPNQDDMPVPTQVRRFHDGYRAYGGVLEAGIIHRPWAKHLSLRVYATDFDKDLQHNIDMTRPFGEITTGQSSVGALARYDLPRIAGSPFGTDALLAFSHRSIDFRDTSSFVYDWFGRRILERQDNRGELPPFASELTQWENHLVGRLRVRARLAPGHELQLITGPDLTFRHGEQRLRLMRDRIDPLSTRRSVFQWVSGAEYVLRDEDLGLENRAFVKHYLYEPASDQVVTSRNAIEPIADSLQRIGAGNALRQRLLEGLIAKASYEHATRMPRPDEVFGDGSLVFPNLGLVPETSHNANLALLLDVASESAGALSIEAGGFFRDTRDMIIELIAQDRNHSVFQNVYRARTLGVDGSLRWVSPGGHVTVQQNATYQDQRNASTSGTFSMFKGERIPNRPWLFANTSLELRFPHFGARNATLSLAWLTHFVREFLPGWARTTEASDDKRIPDQLTHDASLVYSIEGDVSLDFALDVTNVTDAAVYDVLGVQKPGRATYFKVSLRFEPATHPSNAEGTRT